jgi:hypothetical protein
MAKRKKVQKDKQRSTKHTYKTKDRVSVENQRPADGICIQSLDKIYQFPPPIKLTATI